ncbi:unnamed protein product, partial [marine sediment metagenome]
GDVWSGTGIFKSTHGSDPLKLYDINIDGGIGLLPISDDAELGGDTLNTVAQSLLGAIEEIRLGSASKLAYQSGVIDYSGMNVTDQGGLNVKVLSANKSVIVNGAIVPFTSDTNLA